MAAKDSELTENELSLLDHIAELTANVDRNLSTIRETYDTNNDLSVPDGIIVQ